MQRHQAQGCSEPLAFYAAGPGSCAEPAVPSRPTASPWRSGHNPWQGVRGRRVSGKRWQVPFPLHCSLMCHRRKDSDVESGPNKWTPPKYDVVDEKGVMLFPAGSGFELYPGAMHVLSIKELRMRLETYGFTTATVDALGKKAAAQLLMWKYVEAAFIAHNAVNPAPPEYKRKMWTSVPWVAGCAKQLLRGSHLSRREWRRRARAEPGRVSTPPLAHAMASPSRAYSRLACEQRS